MTSGVFPHSPFVCSSLEFPLLFASLLAAQASAEQGQLSAQAPTTCLLAGPLGKVDKEKINSDLLALEGQESQCLSPGAREFTVDTHWQLARPLTARLPPPSQDDSWKLDQPTPL